MGQDSPIRQHTNKNTDIFTNNVTERQIKRDLDISLSIMYAIVKRRIWRNIRGKRARRQAQAE